MSEDTLVDKFNERHFVVNMGSSTVVATDVDSKGTRHPVRFQSFQSFRDFYSNQHVKVNTVTPTGRPSIKYMPAGKYWLGHPRRRQYDRAMFAPGLALPSNEYNLWHGFAARAQAGDWSLFHDHIRTNLCDNDPVLIRYVLGWMARCVQQPYNPGEVALVLRGEKGAGKGTFANLFGRLFAPNYVAIANPVHLVGRFNSHLRECVLLFVDEGFAVNDRRAEGVLKQLITEPEIPIEQKGIDLDHAPNRLHIIICSNESWVVPARGMERRYCVLDVSDARVKDFKYFEALHRQMNHGGLEAMLYDLQAYDLRGFQIRHVPTTETLREQIVHSLRPFENWWYGKLITGRLTITAQTWGRADTTRLYEDYRNSVEHPMKPYSKPRFGLELRKALPGRYLCKARPRTTAGRGWIYLLAPLADCRALWDKQHGVETNWEAEGELANDFTPA